MTASAGRPDTADQPRDGPAKRARTGHGHDRTNTGRYAAGSHPRPRVSAPPPHDRPDRTHHRRSTVWQERAGGTGTTTAKDGRGSMRTEAGEKRRRLDLEHARGNGHIDVADIADGLEVAAETVRRDLKAPEGHGLVRRTHGGAYPTDGAGFETTMTYRSGHRVPEKRRIAAAAASKLGEAETIYLDEGFTPQLVAEELIKLQRPLTMVTASLAVAGALAPVETMSVILLGGRVRGRTLATVDHWATTMLSDLIIDLAILGTNGISRDRGLTTRTRRCPRSSTRCSRCPDGACSSAFTPSSARTASASSPTSPTSRRRPSAHWAVRRRRPSLCRARPRGDPRVAGRPRTHRRAPAGPTTSHKDPPPATRSSDRRPVSPARPTILFDREETHAATHRRARRASRPGGGSPSASSPSPSPSWPAPPPARPAPAGSRTPATPSTC